MRKALALGTAAASLFAVAAAGGAAAQETDTSVTATVAPLSGGRTLAVTTAPSLLTPSSTGVTGSMTATVTETNAAGVNPWSVTAKMKTANLTYTDSTTTPATVHTIASSNMSASASTVTQTTGLLTGQTTATGSGGLGSTGTGVTLMRVEGESSALTYSNVFTAVTPLSLTVPNGTAAGAYAGTMTVTLVQ